jgi:hypothetical protein
VWDDALTITENYITKHQVYKFITDDKIVGYFSYLVEENQTIKLDIFFLLPQYIGMRWGSFFMNDFLNRIQKQDCKKIYYVLCSLF